MGCNYYTKVKLSEIRCPHCKEIISVQEKEIHIGKSSVGWRFTFQKNEEYYKSDFRSLVDWLVDKTIYDEYGRECTLGEFVHLVSVKQSSNCQEGIVKSADFFDFIDGDFC